MNLDFVTLIIILFFLYHWFIFCIAFFLQPFFILFSNSYFFLSWMSVPYFLSCNTSRISAIHLLLIPVWALSSKISEAALSVLLSTVSIWIKGCSGPAAHSSLILYPHSCSKINDHVMISPYTSRTKFLCVITAVKISSGKQFNK